MNLWKGLTLKVVVLLLNIKSEVEIKMGNKKFRWTAIIERINPAQEKIVIAEIGIWKGKMSEKLLQLIPNLYLHMVDRWSCPPKDDSFFESGSQIALVDQKVFDNAFEETMGRVKYYADRCTIYKMISQEAATKIEDNSLDFCFIDGDHSYEGVKTDIEAWFSKVRPGGWICGHDWGKLNKGNVEKAVREAFGDKFELDYNSTWFVQKEA